MTDEETKNLINHNAKPLWSMQRYCVSRPGIYLDPCKWGNMYVVTDVDHNGKEKLND